MVSRVWGNVESGTSTQLCKTAGPCLILALLLGLAAACAKDSGPAKTPLLFWHTFNSNESSFLESWLSGPKQPPVATTILPFARATNRFRSAMEDGQCPDLMRIDATQIPSLVEGGSLHEVPAGVWSKQSYLPEASSLVAVGDKNYGLPQSLDGLALVQRRGAAQNGNAASFASWLSAAREAERKPALGIMLDGYWFVAFLRSAGGDLPGADGLPAANSAEAQLALQGFAQLFADGTAMDLLEERAPARAMVKAFRKGDLEQVLTGPWHLVDLAGGDLESVEVVAFPEGAAPRGGQVLVVPRCAADAQGAWALALALTAPQLQSKWARELGSIPVTKEGLSDAGPLVHSFYAALQHSRPLPRHPRVPELFDDLTPAVVAVVSGDASAEEALAGVSRSWDRLYGIKRVPDEP